jgi:PhzF family phenazine biosynthesis protein
MKKQVFVVNAFARHTFGGNPAAVLPLDEWLPVDTLQNIAMQHNLSETAFVVPKGEDYEIRWFTPALEVALCGHATLAAAHVYFEHLGFRREKIRFHSKSGVLPVARKAPGWLTLDFPADEPRQTDWPDLIESCLKEKPLEIYGGSTDYLAILGDQQAIEKLDPDFSQLSRLSSRGLIVSAPGNDSDFVSRCFYPQAGINEDPVTGSAHTLLTPYWGRKLGKEKLTAIQLSARKGYLECEMQGDRVLISGSAITYLQGDIFI